jgi:long-chain fatty acid transport protein
MMKRKSVAQVVALAVLGIAGQVDAGGLYLYELGTEDLGLANAGSAARAQDASVIAANPAGMTRLQGDQLVVGAQMLYGDVDYDMDNPGLQEPGNIVGWLPGGSFFYSHSVSDDLKIGMALYGNFGLSLSYDDNWSGRTLVKEATLMGLTLQPSLGYRVNDKWSVGAGLGINYGIFSLTRDRLIGGGEAEPDDTDIAYNGKMGLLFEPSEQTRLGLTYTSEVDYNFEINATGSLPFTGGSWTLPISASVGAPQQVMLSGVQVLNSTWSVLASIGWQDWSSFSETDLTFGGVQQSSSLELQDTWHGSVGLQYQLSAPTRLNFGIAYDTSLYKNQDKTSLTIPSGAAWRFGTGVQHQLNEQSSLGAAFEYLMLEDAHVPQPALLAGSYNDPQMYFFSLHYSYRF